MFFGYRTNTTKAAAVAAASASAVAGAGPVAAAAAGAAAAAAVAEALGEQSQELIPCHSGVTITEFDPTAHYATPQPATRALMEPPQEVETGSQRRIFERVRSLSPSTFSDVMFEASSGPQEPGIRRCESFDLGRQSVVGNWVGEGNNKNNGRLVRSESEVWSKTGGHISGSSGLNLGHHRGNSFSDYSNHSNNNNNNHHDTSRTTGHSNHRGSADAVRYSDDNHSNSSLMMVNGRSSGGHFRSHLKADVASGKLNIPSVFSPSRKVDLERPRNGQLTHNLVSEGVNRARLLNGRQYPQRIVSLLPSASEILMQIGEFLFFSSSHLT